jgi:hypothetical protein
MVAVGFHMKALTSGEYEPRLGCAGLHINPLELLGIIINVVLALDWATAVIASAGGHVFKIWTENTSTLYWMKNTAHDTNPIIPCLIRFVMAILVASGIPCIIQGQHIPGKYNMGDDRLSRQTLAPCWESVMAECPTVMLCWRCKVPPVLLSALTSTIDVCGPPGVRVQAKYGIPNV